MFHFFSIRVSNAKVILRNVIFMFVIIENIEGGFICDEFVCDFSL